MAMGSVYQHSAFGFQLESPFAAVSCAARISLSRAFFSSSRTMLRSFAPQAQ
jgi:hypothetical protein